MASLSHLKEELREVFQIYDEDNTGSITFAELLRALYTVTGVQLPRSEVVQLIKTAKEQLSEARKAAAEEMPTDDTRSLETSYTSHRMSPNPFDTAHHGGSDGSAASRRTTHSMAGASTRQFDVTEGIDVGLFEAVVLAKMSARKYEEELKYCFSLLEDSYYEGFITKESLAKAAQAVEEPLTETEIKEMFNALVTGVPTAAIDFSTFVKIQNASKAVQEES